MDPLKPGLRRRGRRARLVRGGLGGEPDPAASLSWVLRGSRIAKEMTIAGETAARKVL